MMPVQDEKFEKVVEGPNYKVIWQSTATPNRLKCWSFLCLECSSGIASVICVWE